jgi:glutathione S-transferase
VDARLYVIPGSHPAMAARLMLERKGIPYKRVDLMPVVAKGVLKAMRFESATVPAMRLDGERVQGTGTIARALDRFRPEPPLLPADQERRAQVEQAERWADGDLQGIARRMLWNATRRDRSSIGTYAEGARLGIPLGVAVKTAAPIIAAAVRIYKADDDAVRHDLAALPGALGRVEAYIDDGTIGGEDPNVADYQVGTCLRLMMTLDDLRPAIESRPAGELALRVVPDFPGRIGPVFPAAWLEPLRAASAAAA